MQNRNYFDGQLEVPHNPHIKDRSERGWFFCSLLKNEMRFKVLQGTEPNARGHALRTNLNHTENVKAEDELR